MERERGEVEKSKAVGERERGEEEKSKAVGERLGEFAKLKGFGRRYRSVLQE